MNLPEYERVTQFLRFPTSLMELYMARYFTFIALVIAINECKLAFRYTFRIVSLEIFFRSFFLHSVPTNATAQRQHMVEYKLIGC